MELDLGTIFQDMLAFDPDRRRTNHLLKVDGYAEMIGLAECMEPDDLFWLRAAALMHDVGIKPSLEKYGDCPGERQQVEGPPAAREMLSRRGAPAERIHRLCWLIAHHHEYADIKDLDHQILVEADFLVNCDEMGMEPEAVVSIRNKIFKTQAGANMFERLFRLP